jgi:hypothetical protein
MVPTMTTPEATLVYGWKRAAAIVGCSERYLRDLAAERDLIADRRPDQAVGLRVVDLEALAAELRSGTSGRRPGAREGDAGPDGEGRASPSDDVPSPASAKDQTEQGAPGRAPDLISLDPTGTPAAVTDEGALAAAIFQDLEAGETMRQIVINQRVTPEIVRAMHDRWTSLAASDALATEPAEARLAKLEMEMSALQGKIKSEEAAVDGRHARLLHRVHLVEERQTNLERRLSADGTHQLVRSLVQRLATIEVLVQRLPAALVSTGRRCGQCGQGPVVSPVACTSCGFGFGSSG